MDRQPSHRLSEIDTERATATCSQCGPETALRFRKHRAQWACKIADARRKPENKRNTYLRIFGITNADFDRMLAVQGGTCAICNGLNVSGRALAVDHCHETGLVRGLLCMNCNTAIGQMSDSPERLLRAAEYLTNRSA